MMPARNTAVFIESAVASVLGQTVAEPFELLICDDASDDQTWPLLQSWARDPRIRLFRNRQPLGCAATRQFLVEQARGDFVSICDSDDQLLEGNLSRYLSVLKTRPEVGVVYGDLLEVETDERGQELGPRWHRQFSFEREWDLMHNLVPNGGTMVRTRLLRQVGGYRNLPNSADWDMWLRLAEITRFHYEKGFIGYLYRRWPGSITRTQTNREEVAMQIVADAVKRRYPKEPPPAEHRAIPGRTG